MRAFLRAIAVAAVATFALAISVAAQPAAVSPTSPSNFDGIKIENFGRMDAGYYRGAQPLPDDYKALADLGINTIVDLRNDPTDYEKSSAEAVGIKYISLPMSGWRSPKDEDVQRFLQIANDPSTGVMYVHCKAGIHRTGITAAIYRMTKYGWDYDTAYQEMKNYHFSTGLVHGALKSYVKKYAKDLETQKASKNAAALALSGSAATATAN